MDSRAEEYMAEPEPKQNVDTLKKDVKNEEAPVEPKPEVNIEDSPEWQARVDKIAQSREDRVRTEYPKKLKDAQKEIEMLRKESMSENEKREYEAQQLKEALDAKEKDLTRREMELLAVKTLEEKKLPSAFVDMVIGEDKDSTLKRIDLIEKTFADEIKAAVDIKMKAYGRQPYKGGASDVNSFEGMSPAEIQKKTREDPDWFRKNESAILAHFKEGYKK